METNYKEFETVSFPSSIDNISVAENLVDRVCRENDVHEDHFGNVLIAVTEAVVNAIHHGNLNDPSLTVSIEVIREGKKLCFVIKDCGRGFDFNSLPDPTSPENIEKENGRGIFLMKSLADDVYFEKSGSEVHIAFNIL